MLIILLTGISPTAYSSSNKLRTSPISLFLPKNPDFKYAAFYTAIEKRYYAEKNINLQLITDKNHHKPVDAVISGEADLSIDSATLLLDYSHGKQVIALGALLQNTTTGIYSLKNHNIRTPADFLNKAIISQPNTGKWIIDSILNNCMLNYKSIKYIPGNISTDFTNLLRGNIDILVTDSTSIQYQLQHDNIDYNVIYPTDYNLNFYDGILFTSKKFLQNHSDTVKNFLEATWKGWNYALLHKNETIKLIREKYNTQISVAELEDEAAIIYKQTRPDIIPPGSMTVERWKETVTALINTGYLPANFTLDGFLYCVRPSSNDYTAIVWICFAFLFILIFSAVLFFFNNNLKKSITVTNADLKENQQRLQIALENAREGLWDWDIKNNSFFYTPGCFTILGYKPDEIEYSLDIWKSFIHPDDYSRVTHAITSFIYKPKEYSDFFIDLKIRTKKHNYINISLQLTSQEISPTGEADRIIATQKDITNEKKNEKILKNRIYQLTRPLHDIHNLKFSDIFDIDKIQSLQDSFAAATNTTSIIIDPQGNDITLCSNPSSLCKFIRSKPECLKLCHASNASFKSGKVQYHIKSCDTLGLINGGTSIWVDDKMIACWFIGQVRYDTKITAKMKETIKNFNLNMDDFIEKFNKIPVISPKKFAAACNVMSIMAEQLSELAYQNIIQARTIHEKHQTESQLRKSERKLREAQKLSHVGHWTFNPETNRITGSREFWEILNLSNQKDGVLATHFLDKITVNDKSRIIKAFYSGLTSNLGIDIEFSLNNNTSKEKKYLHLITQKHREENELNDINKLPLLQGTLQDITDRAKYESDLKESRENLRITLESIADGLITTNRKGLVTQINPVALKILDYHNSNDVIGKNITDVLKFYESETRLPTTNPVTEVLQTKEKVFYKEQLIIISQNENELYIIASASPLLNQESKLFGVVLTLHDVTEQYLLEESLKQSQKMEAIGKLAGGIAHDFNNLLGGIIGFADLINLQNDNEKVREYTNQIIDTAERASDLTSQMLTFARKESSATIPVDVHECIKKALAILEHSIKKTIIISQNFVARNSIILGDAAQLQNCILNLGINARDAMKTNGEFTVSTENIVLDEDYCRNSEFTLSVGEYIRITAKDTGTGIPPGIIKKIFEPFFTTKAVGKGTGLGLSALFGTIVNHNGSVTVKSKENSGTQFEILLPVTDARPEEKAKISGIIYANKRKTILLVDDELVIRTIGKSIFEDSGYNVLLAENGEQALKVYLEKSHEIDLVLMDMVMPVMDGEEALQRLLEMNPKVKVILTSGFPRSENITRLLELGAAEFITKPYKTIDILNVINKII